MGEKVLDVDLVHIALNNMAKTWAIFVEYVDSHEYMSTWDRLWDDFIQEENHRGYVQGNTSHNKDEDENVALAAKGKKKMFKKDP